MKRIIPFFIAICLHSACPLRAQYAILHLEVNVLKKGLMNNYSLRIIAQ